MQRVNQHRESSKDSDVLVPKGCPRAFCSKPIPLGKSSYLAVPAFFSLATEQLSKPRPGNIHTMLMNLSWHQHLQGLPTAQAAGFPGEDHCLQQWPAVITSRVSSAAMRYSPEHYRAGLFRHLPLCRRLRVTRTTMMRRTMKSSRVARM